VSEGVEYHVRAVLEAAKGDQARRQMQRWAGGVSKAASILDGAGSRMDAWGGRLAGHTAMVAGATASIAASAALAAGAYGMGQLVVGGVAFNKELENAEMKTAAVLQLFDKGGKSLSGATLSTSEQFGANLVTGQQAIEKIYTIAARSPASFEQTQQMFSNMLPGATAVGASMEQVYDLTKKSLAMGMIMGGDFQTTGAQMSRILTGGAGAEFETWKVLQTPILEAGKAVGIFGEEMEANQKLTEKFNQLSKDQRLYLVQTAIEKLGVVTDAYGETWDGVTSTIGSNLQQIQREIGRTAFTVLKARLGAAVKNNGAFDPEGQTQNRLVWAGQFIGQEIGTAADYLVGKMIDGTIYVADHWQEIGDKLLRAFDTGVYVGELLLKFAAAKALFGHGIQLAGGALGAAGGAVEAIEKLGGALASVGVGALYALPLAVTLGAALAGVGVAFAGVAAYFVANWDMLMQGILGGTITLGPVFDAMDILWAQLVAIGEAFLGSADPAQTANELLLLIADSMHFAGGAMVVFLKTAGYTSVVIQGLIGVFASLYQAVLAIITGFNSVILSLAEIPGVSKIPVVKELMEGLGSGQKALQGHMVDVERFIGQQFDGESRFLDAAAAAQKALDNFDPEKGVTAGMRERLKKSRQEGGLYGPELPPSGTRGLLNAADLKKGGHTTHIHKLIYQADLRNQDPDRVVGAFFRKVEEISRKPVQASTAVEGGL
jgi:hypothetical protein